ILGLSEINAEFNVLSIDPKDRAVDVFWALPVLNPDGSKCKDIAGVYLLRSVNKEGPYTLVTPEVIPPQRSRWHDDQKVNGVTYYYKVRPVDDVGNIGDFSPYQEATPYGDNQPPTPPVLFVKQGTPPNVELTWTPSIDDSGIDHYNIYAALTEIKEEYISNERKGMPSLIPSIAEVDGNTLEYIFKKGKPGTLYFFVVTGVDTSGNESKPSNCESLIIPGKDITPPIIESVSEDTYHKPQKAGKEITVLLVGEAKLSATYTLGTFAVNQPMKETAKPGTYFAIYKVKPGDNGLSIPISVKLQDAAGNKSEKKYSVGAITGVDIDTIPPASIDEVTYTVDFETTSLYINPRVVFSWNKPIEVETYRVYRHTEAITEKNLKQAALIAKKLSKDILKYKDVTATPGKTYYYSVANLDLAENEGLSPSVKVQINADVNPPKIDKISEDTLGVPQKAGNTIQVTLHGEPGCTGFFDIGTKVINVPMQEIMIETIHTGTYSGKYVVKEDDDIYNVPVMGKLRDAFNNEATKQTETNIIIKTRSTDTTPPEITSFVHNQKNKILIEKDVLKVTLVGEQDGIAFFDIGNMVKGIKLYQTAVKGTYEGQYIVKNGDNIGNAEIRGYLADDSGNVTTKVSEDTLTIDTSIKIVLAKENAIEYLVADSTSSVSIIATVTDSLNNPVEGRKIDFSLMSNYGKVETIKSITDAHGKAYGKYTVGPVVQTAYICAEDMESGVAGITSVRTSKITETEISLITPYQRKFRTFNGQYYIDLDAHPQRITADGSSVSIITATVRKAGATGVPGPKKYEETDTNKNIDEKIPGEKVKFTITSYPEGSPGVLKIHPKYLNVEEGGALTDENGEAKAIYTAGTKIGMVIIHALAPLSVDKGEPIAEMVGIFLIAGEVRYLTIVARPAVLNANGVDRSNITVTAEDSFRNPCRDVNVNVELLATDQSLGSIVGVGSNNAKNMPTNEKGEAYAQYTAGTQAGNVIIRATVYSNTPIDDGVVQYDAGNYSKAIEVFKKAIADYPQDNWTDDVYYMLGYSQELMKDYTESIFSYNEVVRYYFGGPWADNALYRVGQSYEKMGQYARAIDAYQELMTNAYLLENIEVYKNNLIDNALFRMGIMYERLEHYELAKEKYQELIDRFKDSDETSLVDDAQIALDQLRARGY
ncbi:MAG: Ig-like domain-containing protein, partial [Candidatus Firestonebacteria bacterium]|nr:Ig-like domain-containing protein [Candidatus Firestonebacteria bacterium]